MAEHKKPRSTSFFHSRLISIISIALVLFLSGIILLMGLSGSRLSVYVKENLSFSILLKENQKEAEILQMQKDLLEQPYVKSAVYISKKDALEELKEELGGDPEAFLGFNPLQASLEVKLHWAYANPDSLRRVEKSIMSYASVSDVLYRKDMLEAVHSHIRKAGILLLVLVGILITISFVLVGNTLRLLIYSKRFLIHTMKLVGATPGFIRRPFLLYNMVSGIISAMLALLLLAGLFWFLQREVNGLARILDIQTLIWVAGAVLIAGISLPVISTVFAVNKYLRTESDKLYYL